MKSNTVHRHCHSGYCLPSQLSLKLMLGFLSKFSCWLPSAICWDFFLFKQHVSCFLFLFHFISLGWESVVFVDFVNIWPDKEPLSEHVEFFFENFSRAHIIIIIYACDNFANPHNHLFMLFCIYLFSFFCPYCPVDTQLYRVFCSFSTHI